HNFGTYFATSQTWERRSLFQTTELAELLLSTLKHYRREDKYLLHEFVLMPNHFHVIITTNQITLEKAMQFIKGGFSHRVRQTGRTNLEVWQKGFTDHRIRDSEDYFRHQEYLWLNPVKANLCSQPADFLYSSAGYRDE